jgi:Spy/CpxP family protein refolding chaperone
MKTTLLTLTAAATLAFAQPSGTPPAPPVDAVKAYLSLTDDQITSIQTIQKTVRQANQSVAASIQTKQQALQTLLDAGTADAAAVGKLVIDIRTLNKQIETSMKAAQAQSIATLTADQKAKLTKLEEAAALRPEINQASSLGLLAPQAGGPGMQGGPGGPGMQGGPGGMAPLRRARPVM